MKKKWKKKDTKRNSSKAAAAVTTATSACFGNDWRHLDAEIRYRQQHHNQTSAPLTSDVRIYASQEFQRICYSPHSNWHKRKTNCFASYINWLDKLKEIGKSICRNKNGFLTDGSIFRQCIERIVNCSNMIGEMVFISNS